MQPPQQASAREVGFLTFMEALIFKKKLEKRCHCPLVGGVGVGVGGWYDCKSWEEQRGTHRFVTDWTSLHQADAQLPILPKCCLLALPCADQVCIHTMFTMQAMHGQTVEDPSTQSRSFSLILFHQGPLLVSRGVGQIKYPFRDM